MSKVTTDEDRLDIIEKVALELYEKYRTEEIIVKTPNFTITVRRPEGQPVIDKNSFDETYKYLKNAKKRFDTKTPEGYSDCKTNCRCALVSTLKTLTGKEEIRDAAKELGKQGILGKREEEFIESFGEMIVKLHWLDSKKGPHPPMTRDEDDAELALGITTSVVNYIVNQSTRPRV